MMKKLILILLALPFLGIAQETDWFPMPSDQVSYFKYSDIHINTMKVDSIIQTDSGKLYYNVKNPVRIVAEEEHSYYDPFSSWLGKTTLIENGYAHFYDAVSFKQITVNYERTNNTPWLFYDSEDDYYEAHIEAYDYIEILDGVFDSVKYIDLQYFSKNENKNELYYDHAIVLSKNFGFIKTISFNKREWGLSYNYRELIGLETEEGNYGWAYNFYDYIKNYKIGDELHYSNSNTDFIDVIIDKEQTEDYIEYTYRQCRDDGTNSVYSQKILLGKYPRQTIVDKSNGNNLGFYRFFYSDDDWQAYHQHHFQFFFEYSEYEYNGEFVWRYTPEGSNCLRVPMYGCNEMNNSIIEDCAWQQWNIVYFDNGDMVFGEPWDFSCDISNLEGDWFPMPAEQLSYFSTIRDGGGNVPTDYTSFSPMMIDSIKYDGAAMIYYNVKTPVIIGDDDDSYNFYDPYQTWVGSSVRFEDGMAQFQNIDEENIFVKYHSNINEPWLCYTYENGEYIESLVSELAEIEILEGLTDSVKYISFQKYNSQGEAIASFFDDKQIILSKNYGFVETFIFSKFPNSGTKQLTTLEVGDNQYGFSFAFNDVISSYEVDDTVHLQVFNNDYYLKSNIIEKELSDDFVEYTIEECKKVGETPVFKESKYKYFKRLAGQSIFDENGNPIGFYNISSYNSGEKDEGDYLVTFKTDLEVGEYNGHTVWAIEFSLGQQYSHDLYRVNDICVFPYSDQPGEFSEILYYHIASGQWGEALEYQCSTAIGDVLLEKVSISPNPSNGIFNITNNSSQKIDNIDIINTNGQTVWSQKVIGNKQEIDLNNFPSGIYLIKMQYDNNQVIFEKIMIL